METTDEEGWVTDPRVLDVVFALEGMQPGDLITLHQGELSQLGNVDGLRGQISHLRFERVPDVPEQVARFDFLPPSKDRRGNGTYWIRRCSIAAWKPMSKKGGEDEQGEPSTEVHEG